MANAAIFLNQQVTLINQASNAYTADGNSGWLDASGFRNLLAGVDVTAVSGGNAISFYLEGEAPDGNWYLFASTNHSGTGQYMLAGDALEPMFPDTVRLRWALNGDTSATFSFWVIGQ